MMLSRDDSKRAAEGRATGRPKEGEQAKRGERKREKKKKLPPVSPSPPRAHARWAGSSKPRLSASWARSDDVSALGADVMQGGGPGEGEKRAWRARGKKA